MIFPGGGGVTGPNIKSSNKKSITLRLEYNINLGLGTVANIQSLTGRLLLLYKNQQFVHHFAKLRGKAQLQYNSRQEGYVVLSCESSKFMIIFHT